MSSEVSPAMQPVVDAATLAAAVALLLPQIQVQLPPPPAPPTPYTPPSFVEGGNISAGVMNITQANPWQEVPGPDGFVVSVNLPDGRGFVGTVSIHLPDSYTHAVPIIPLQPNGASQTIGNSHGNSAQLLPGTTLTLAFIASQNYWVKV